VWVVLSRFLEKAQNIRVPLPILVIFWLYSGYKFFRTGYISDAWKAAKGYMREVKI
jgi:hypothetical protein